MPSTESSIAIRDLFVKLNHYSCCNFVIEDINSIKIGDYGNKKSNRKINNVWLRNYITLLIEKYCRFYGIKLIKVNPIYSSFIGNIIYNEYDPVAASVEIMRRGMVKYTKKGKLLPSFHKGVITDLNDNLLFNEMDYNKLLNKNIYSWKELYKLCSTCDRDWETVYPF